MVVITRMVVMMVVIVMIMVIVMMTMMIVTVEQGQHHATMSPIAASAILVVIHQLDARMPALQASLWSLMQWRRIVPVIVPKVSVANQFLLRALLLSIAAHLAKLSTQQS
jgi:ABC-type transport system involved in cytochrome bd biosynthesis fused ATPase/permease subunit